MIPTFEVVIAVLVGAIALGVLVGMVTAWIAVEHFHRRTLARIARSEQKIDAEWKLLDEQRKLQLRMDGEIRNARRNLGHQTKETVAKLRAESEHFDTMINVLDIDDLPHPSDTADTVAMPAVNDD